MDAELIGKTTVPTLGAGMNGREFDDFDLGRGDLDIFLALLVGVDSDVCTPHPITVDVAAIVAPEIDRAEILADEVAVKALDLANREVGDERTVPG